MTAASLDVLTGGRFRLGLGVCPDRRYRRAGMACGSTSLWLEPVSTSRWSASAFAVDGDFQGEHYQLPLSDGPASRSS